MTLAADHQYGAFDGLAIVTGSAAVAAVVLLTASLVSLSHATTDTTPTFSRFERSPEVLEPVAFAIVPSPVIGANPQFYFGSGDGSSGYYAERPDR